jgi:hypothetical protein
VLKAAKWIMLLFMLCEVVALVLSLLLRFVLEDPATSAQYDNFDTNNLQVRPATECSSSSSSSWVPLQAPTWWHKHCLLRRSGHA